ncbi:TetR/AcrR family transcriptional regulator [Actinomadura atramentaria]|uniref:TetR/AcrR family transcriptional regulator n=1 Tax=Actinomadura atramentaria TaxID=1990 RepID=UPI000368AFD2|nr:TetR/AcrR family transcriptional regulator [Actinomadura atramentaria]
MSDDSGMPTPPGHRPRRARPARRPLSADVIVDTGMRVLDAEGLDAVTMRRVAQELGTGPASLYAHVGSKDELYELMHDRAAAQIRLPEPDPARWREQLAEVAFEARRVLASHRDLARVSLGAIPVGPNVLRIAEFQLALLRGAGIPKRIAAMAVDTLAMYVDADVIEGAIFGGGATGPDAERTVHENRIEPIRAYFNALPPDRYPTLVGMVDELVGGTSDERFEFGLDIFLRGIASYAPS